MTAHDDTGSNHGPSATANAGDGPGGTSGDLVDQEGQILGSSGGAAVNAQNEVELHGSTGNQALISHVHDGIQMTDFKALVLGLDVVFQHTLTESAHGGHIVDEDVVTEVAGTAVQSGHFGHQLGGLQTLVGSHAGSAAGRGNQNCLGASFLNSGQDLSETLLGLSGLTVVGTDMDVDDGSAGIVSGLSLANHFLLGVGDGGVVLLGDFSAADSSSDDQLFHWNQFLSRK